MLAHMLYDASYTRITDPVASSERRRHDAARRLTMQRRRILSAMLGTVATAATHSRASARDGEDTLRIAVQTETSSLDPHFALIGAN